MFRDELGIIKGTRVRFEVDAHAQPKFSRALPVSYTLCSKDEAGLECLERSNIITPVTFSKWAAPTVPVLKQDGKVRIYGDYKLTLNQATKTDPYPLPRIEELFASLSKGKSFSKLDLAHAYQQILLLDEAKELTTINTHKGLSHKNWTWPKVDPGSNFGCQKWTTVVKSGPGVVHI